MSYNHIFNPKTIAIIGASQREGSVGNAVFTNLLTQGFSGELYPVNPKQEEIAGVKCFASYQQIPVTPDLAIIIIPAAFVPQSVKEIAQKGTKAVIIISAGFKEIGHEGSLLEEEINQICIKNNITLVGVNCLGAMNVNAGINASFAANLPLKGNIGFVAQSGALCTSVIDYSKQLGLGFSKIVSVGNKTTFNEMEVLEYFESDEETSVVMMYLEDINAANDMLMKAKNLTKPVIVLKSGRTEEGRAAAASHTGALGGADAVYEALFRQSNIIRANTIEELFNYSLMFSKNPLPKGPKVGIITNAGGPGGITIDAVSSNGLKVAQLKPETAEILAKNLPAAASVKNPVDVLGDAQTDRYEMAINTVLSDDEVDSLIVILTPQSMTEPVKTAQAIIKAKQLSNKPIVVSFMGMEIVSEGAKLLSESGVATIAYPDQAAKALSVLWKKVLQQDKQFSTKVKVIPATTEHKQKVQSMFEAVKNSGQNYLPENLAKEVLDGYHLPVLKSFVVTSAQEALEKAKLIDAENLVCKIVSKDIFHKSDVGGVILNVKPEKADEAYAQIIENINKNSPDAEIEGVLMVPMINKDDGYELILGVANEPGVGKSIVFGMGGIMVEVMKDVTFSLAPIDELEAERMISRIQSSPIFDGVRGRPAMDKESLIQTILQLSTLVTDFPEISELDINPLLILPDGKGCKVLDSKIVLD